MAQLLERLILNKNAKNHETSITNLNSKEEAVSTIHETTVMSIQDVAVISQDWRRNKHLTNFFPRPSLFAKLMSKFDQNTFKKLF